MNLKLRFLEYSLQTFESCIVALLVHLILYPPHEISKISRFPYNNMEHIFANEYIPTGILEDSTQMSLKIE